MTVYKHTVYNMVFIVDSDIENQYLFLIVDNINCHIKCKTIENFFQAITSELQETLI